VPTKTLLGSRAYSLDDQKLFATLSGDFNPLHLDPTAARRTIFGAPVVHGMHSVVWALELYLARLKERGVTALSIRSLSANFPKPMFLGERVDAHLLEETTDSAHIQVATGGTIFADMQLRSEEPGSTPSGPDCVPGDYSRISKTLALPDLTALSGVVPLAYDSSSLRRHFPVCCALLGGRLVSGLMTLSRLVGMECPGLHSLFSSFEMDLVPHHDAPVLHFTVERVDPRFSAVRLSVTGAGFSGTVNAFLRPPPTEQVRVDTVAGTVAPREFAGQRALVVGGSRGLGEVTAKIIACGGGHPVITYRHGADDAERVADEIRRWGASCDVIRLDVKRPRLPLLDLARNGWLPTHLYYFATPRIFVRRTRVFDDLLFRRFAAAYVGGFFRTYEACRSVTRGPLAVFYPSSVAVDEKVKDLTEYAAAKAAGETLCRHIERSSPDTRVLIERLPRVRTDQTATLLQVPAADGFEIMCEIARRLART
jgi:acyl dehydratase/NAD(P)-dependent dehydrogenase (short-subunit alcohol dehydrogenase family)